MKNQTTGRELAEIAKKMVLGNNVAVPQQKKSLEDRLAKLLTEDEQDDDNLAYSIVRNMKRGYDLCLKDKKSPKKEELRDAAIRALAHILQQAQTPNTFDPSLISNTALLRARIVMNNLKRLQ